MPRVLATAACVGLFAATVVLATVRDGFGALAVPGDAGDLLYLRSPTAVRRLALSYDALAADIYWIRAVQYYGGTRLSADATKNFDRLLPLLDLTTALDPYFTIAYRFGAIFLAESYPSGAGRPDQAIALLEKGLAAQPDRWEFAQDIGFVHYWWLGDYPQAAAWFLRASAIPGAPEWLKPLAAQVAADGGNRDASRQLWLQLRDTAESDWLRRMAETQLRQLGEP